MKLSIIVPVYNEEKTIGRVVKRLLDLGLSGWTKEILVVDDCSTDQTRKTLGDFAEKGLVRVFGHRRNSGKTAAIKTGLLRAKGGYVIVQDADLEYDPGDIKKLVAKARENKGAVIYGSRFKGPHEDTVFGHKFGNIVLTALTNLLYGSRISDMETCYKLIPNRYLQRMKLESCRFNFEPEVTAKLLRQKVRIIEVPISYRKRGFSEGKKIHWWDGISAIWTLVKYRLVFS